MTPDMDFRPMTTTFDLSSIVEVAGEYEPPKVNAMLADGWTLLAAGVDANGYPSFVLGRAGYGHSKGSPE